MLLIASGSDYGREVFPWAIGDLEHCRTLRLILDLNPQAVRLAEARWQRLLLYALSFRTLAGPNPAGQEDEPRS